MFLLSSKSTDVDRRGAGEEDRVRQVHRLSSFWGIPLGVG